MLAVDVTGCEGGLVRERGGNPLVREGERSEIGREARKRESLKRESETGNKWSGVRERESEGKGHGHLMRD
jgi:hypothetical protein